MSPIFGRWGAPFFRSCSSSPSKSWSCSGLVSSSLNTGQKKGDKNFAKKKVIIYFVLMKIRWKSLSCLLVFKYFSLFSLNNRTQGLSWFELLSLKYQFPTLLVCELLKLRNVYLWPLLTDWFSLLLFYLNFWSSEDVNHPWIPKKKATIQEKENKGTNFNIILYSRHRFSYSPLLLIISQPFPTNHPFIFNPMWGFWGTIKITTSHKMLTNFDSQ